MTARNGEGVYGDGVGVVTPGDHKLSQMGPLVRDSTGAPRSGVFYAGTASLVTGKANMSYDVAAFEAAISRGRTKGVSFPTNDAVVNVSTTTAPGSNSRIDIIYVQQQEVSEGDAITGAVIGVVQGTASSSPVAPSIPSGAIELARATVPAGITATTSATITQTAPFTAPLGGLIVFRTTTERNAASVQRGQLGYLLSSDSLTAYDGSSWGDTFDDTGWVSATLTNSWVTNAGLTPQYRRRGGVVFIRGRVAGGTSSTSAFTLPAGLRPTQGQRFACVEGAGAVAYSLLIGTDGTVSPGTAGSNNPNINVCFSL